MSTSYLRNTIVQGAVAWLVDACGGPHRTRARTRTPPVHMRVWPLGGQGAAADVVCLRRGAINVRQRAGRSSVTLVCPEAASCESGSP